jgi:DNA repair protein RecN (Recombination protein N)
MLKKLKVQNYALIQNLDIAFNNDFSTLTGETGAGKSILLGALSLVLGARADSTALNNNQDKCVVEGVFKIDNYPLKPFFQENDLDWEPETILRREISTSGKSRAFINDTPVTLNVLKDLATQLIDIHSQHESLELNNNLFQLKVIDSVAQNAALLNDYKNLYEQYKYYINELNNLRELAQNAAKDLDYNLFQYTQLVSLNLASVDQSELESELEILNNADEIQQNLSVCYSVLSGDEINVLHQLKIAKQALERIKNYYLKATELLGRVESISIDLKDMAQETEISAGNVESDPQKAQQIKEILDGLYDAYHKHQVNSVAELIGLEEHFKRLVDQQSNIDFDIKAAEKNLNETTQKLEKLADALTQKRDAASGPFIKKIVHQLTELGMPHASFKVAMESNSHFGLEGKDKVSFMFSANKNQTEQNISKIASGGEISRLMLSIKAILSESIALPTIIFDEIDTGVSGEIADKMATIMKQMAQNMQVISITHLPQIAARGQNHYKVYKEEDDQSVKTQIVLLNTAERIEEIARLLSGRDISKEAIENAKTLIYS